MEIQSEKMQEKHAKEDEITSLDEFHDDRGSSSGNEEGFDEFQQHYSDEDPVDAELVINDDSDQLQEEQTATWSAYFSGAGLRSSEDDEDDEEDSGNAAAWNINEMFSFAFRMRSSANEISEEAGILDDDVRQLLQSEEFTSQELVSSRVHSLIQRLLSLENPRLSEQLVEFLFTEDNLDVFLTYITRLDLQKSKEFDWFSLTSLENFKRVQRNRDMSDENAQRLSFNAIAVLCGTFPTNTRLLDFKLRNILLRIFDSFHPESEANFYHFHQLYFNLLLRAPAVVLDYFLTPVPAPMSFTTDSHQTLDSPSLQKPLIFRCIPYLNIPKISDLVFISLIKRVSNDDSDAIHQRRRYEELLKEEFIEEILQILLIKDSQDELKSQMIANTQFLHRWIEEACDVEYSNIIFKSIEADPRTVNRLLDCLSNENIPLFQKELVLEILHLFSVKTLKRPVKMPPMEQMMSEGVFTPPKEELSSVLTPTSNGVNRILSTRMQTLFDLFDAPFLDNSQPIKLSSLTIDKPLSIFRMQLLEIISEIFHFGSETNAILESMPEDFWRQITDLFFDLRTNNHYHGLYYKIFRCSIKSGSRIIMKLLITKQRLLQRLIECYNETSSENHGHILLIFNFLRLTADTQAGEEYIPQVLSSSEEYKDFLEILQKETLKQVVRDYPADVEGRPIPPPHFGPGRFSNPASPVIQPLPTVLDLEGEINTLNLGSAYAESLGFFEKPSTLNKDKKKRKKKKKRKSSINGNGVTQITIEAEDEELTGSDSENEFKDEREQLANTEEVNAGSG